MNPTILFTLLSLVICFSPSTLKISDAQETSPMKMETEECSHLYSFNGGIIFLEKNSYTQGIISPGVDFKKCSKFSHRFTNPISDTVHVNGSRFTIEDNKNKKTYRLHVHKEGSKEQIIDLPVENPLPEVHEYYFSMFPWRNNVIMFMRDFYSTHYTICKYDENGKEVMRDSIEHTYVTHPEPKTNEYHPYLYFNEITATQMVFSSNSPFAGKEKTVLLDMEDFSQTEYKHTANGLILDENEEKLIGFVTEDDGRFTVQMLDDKKYHFTIKSGNPGCDFILKDSLLYIANYHPIASGSSLHCFDLKTKEMKWTADVLQANIPHSEYYNTVILSMYKDKIIMEGIEASAHYVQLFDSRTGERLAQFGLLEPQK